MRGSMSSTAAATGPRSSTRPSSIASSSTSWPRDRRLPVSDAIASVRTIDDERATAVADELIGARRTAHPIAPLTVTMPGLTPDDAYEIQRRIVTRHLAEGETIVGWKLGLTSAAMQAQLGVDQPDYGAILSGSVIADGGSVDASRLMAPPVEAEIAVVLRGPLTGRVSRDEVLDAIDGLSAALEVIDSRIADWKITLPDTVADMASTAHVIVSSTAVPIERFEPRLVGAVLEKDGHVVATGAGAAVLGDPITAVGWAAETLGRLGVTLDAGDVVMTGALHASVPIAAGDRFQVTLDRLGSVSVTIT